MPSCNFNLSVPKSLPNEIPSDIVTFAFDGESKCTSSTEQTADSAMLWLEDCLIDILQPCAVNTSPDCYALTTKNGKITPVSALELMQCIPFTAKHQVVIFDGTNAVLGYPNLSQSVSWLSLSDTFSSSPSGDYVGLAGGIPLVNDSESGLILSPCLPASSVCPGEADQILVNIDDGAGNIVPAWSEPDIGITSWIDLSDTDPLDYVGRAGFVSIVNAGETGLDLTCLPLASICPPEKLGQLIQTLPAIADPDELEAQIIDCLPVSSVCPGTERQLIQTLPSAADAAILQPQYINCFPQTSICEGTEGQVLRTTTLADGTIQAAWVTIEQPDNWIDLTDTDPTSYVGLDGTVSIVNTDEDGLELKCVPVSSICPGSDRQLIQTLPTNPDPLNPELEPQYINCFPQTSICEGTEGQVLRTTTLADGTIQTAWVTIEQPDNWIDLTDTDPTSYAGLDGTVSIVNTDEDGLELKCVPVSSICPGAERQFIQTLPTNPDPLNPDLQPQYINCFPQTAICEGTEGQVLRTTTLADGTIQTAWVDLEQPDSWIDLTDTDPTSYVGLDGAVSIVNSKNDGTKDGDGLELKCVPVSSICPGAERQFIQTLPTNPDPLSPELQPQYINCFPQTAICPGTDGQILLTTTLADGTVQAAWVNGGGASSWLDLTDTDPTSYATHDGDVSVVNTDSDGLDLKCVPVTSICADTAGQLIQTLFNTADPPELEAQYINCLPIAQLCPGDDDCTRLVTRNGAVEWVHDSYINLCDTLNQPDPGNDQVPAATITDAYDSWGGAIASRVSPDSFFQPSDTVQFVSQSDPNTPPVDGQVLKHDLDDGGDLVTHYYKPIHLYQETSPAQAGDDRFSLDIRDGLTVFPVFNSFASNNLNILEGDGEVITDIGGTQPSSAFPGEEGFVIQRNGRYSICLRMYVRVNVFGVQPGEAQVVIQSNLGVLKQPSAFGFFQEYFLGNVQVQVGSNWVSSGHQVVNFVSGCVTTHLSAGDLVRISVTLGQAGGNPVFQNAQNPVGVFASYLRDGASTISISELNGYDAALTI